MKRYIQSERQYSDRAKDYQMKHAKGYNPPVNPKIKLREDYVTNLKSQVAEIEDELRDSLFTPVITNDELMDKAQDAVPWTSKYISKGAYGPELRIEANSDCILCIIEPNCANYRYGGGSNFGLQWLADLQSGGDGKIRNNYLSKLPIRVKRKLSEYLDIIADQFESRGFEILAAPKGRVGYSGYVLPLTTSEYDKLID